MQITYQPYTYLIGWSSANVWYYGAEYGSKMKTAHPSNLWKSYFTSSPRVKSFRKIHGEPDIIEIRKTFNTRSDCLKWESTVLRRLKVESSAKWLNLSDNRPTREQKRKGGTKNKGRKRPDLSARNRATKGITYSNSSKQKRKETWKLKMISGYISPKKHKPRPSSDCIKISLSHKGNPKPWLKNLVICKDFKGNVYRVPKEEFNMRDDLVGIRTKI